MIKVITGNLFDTKSNVIIHQTNCMGKMGSGVAKQVRNLYPLVEREYRKYLKYCEDNRIEPLGTVQFVPTEAYVLESGIINSLDESTYGDTFYDGKYIVNLFGQKYYGYDGALYTNYSALNNGFKKIHSIITNKDSSFYGKPIAMPYKIACDRGGGDWTIVRKMINEIFSDVEVELWKLS